MFVADLEEEDEEEMMALTAAFLAVFFLALTNPDSEGTS